MKGIRFYLEHNSPSQKRNGHHNGNVFAAFVCNGRHPHGGWEGRGAVFFEPNSPVCGTTADADYLRRYCKRISEAKAREIHPALFADIDRKSVY